MTIAILGAGVMGATLLSAFVRAGHPVDSVVVSDKVAERAADVAHQHGVQTLDAASAVAEADIIVLSVKPQDMSTLLDEVSAVVRPEALVISIAAGISTEFLEDHLPEQTSVVRAMPNTPALVDQAMSAISRGRHCSAVQAENAVALLGTIGSVITLDEHHLDAVTALSGSGPAYIFYVVEAMIEAGVLLGLPRATASELVIQTCYGAATMLRDTGQHPTVLREQVSSPGGTSVAALRELDDHKVRAAFMTAIEAAAQRSKELSQAD